MKGLYYKDDKWYSRIQFEGYRYKKCWGPVTRKVAQYKHSHFKGKIYSGEYQAILKAKQRQAQRVTLNEFKEPYLEYYEHQFRPNSYKRVKVALKPLCKALGSLYLDEIQPLDIAL
jgi:hypothetical protein